MRSLLLAGAALLTLTAAMSLETRTASAAVCADGVWRAGCVGPRGAVVVRKPAPVVVCKTVWVNGVRVKKCG
ncbi:MAG: hypothetical protein DI543_10090 [Bradyrhizobium icense]|nr:MAG: hypothetical protein DI543_10090 [Bradyrhizobium icense]